MSTSKSLHILLIDESNFTEKLQPAFKGERVSFHSLIPTQNLEQAFAEHRPDLIILEWPLQKYSIDMEKIAELAQQASVLCIADEKALPQLRELNISQMHCIAQPLELKELQELIRHYASTTEKQNAPVAQDPYSRQLMAQARQVARYNVPVMITGESGVGKEVMARYIHDHSDRAAQPFIAVNCAAIPATMLEAIMFGYMKGAFTGAIKDNPGKFELAQNGTILLDEISEMPMELQAKLLRVLQEKEVERIGSHKTIALNVRILATTNRNLQQEVSKGNFRMDLFYRLNVFPLHWIPLRQRPLDILPLVEYLVAYHAKMQDRSVVPQLTFEAKRMLLAHEWLGNAREVDNVIQRALILQPGNILDTQDFQFDDMSAWMNAAAPTVAAPAPTDSDKHSPSSASSLEEQETDLVLKTLKQTLGNRTRAAKLLKISPRTLRYKLARLKERGLAVPEARSELLEG